MPPSASARSDADGANNIAWDANDIFMRFLYGHIHVHIELKQ